MVFRGRANLSAKRQILIRSRVAIAPSKLLRGSSSFRDRYIVARYIATHVVNAMDVSLFLITSPPR